ncbi:class E sortase [Methanobacterium alcaliphilum]|uniref:class E sortase n=1 Tax=Methanobacterium alcaliphilum TaxID=392018 RepID=UPI00200AAC0D|nr:class E sortase [Methanobacterium alcaliphilum]MCK9151220.1 class E sortase [Methanobacterium alcaliphilum]
MNKSKTFFLIIISLFIIFSFSVLFTSYSGLNQLNNTSQAEKNNFPVLKTKIGLRADITEPTQSLANSRLIIPKINADYQIRTDTVNKYNSVYHYPNSVLPGEKGECGLLGHRTTFSAPFKKLNTLKIGDEVIIEDLVSSKKYIYQVTSNGDDIRWDYKTKPIQFSKGGESRLMLVTCYRPGKKTGAWVTHCKLVSVSN